MDMEILDKVLIEDLNYDTIHGYFYVRLAIVKFLFLRWQDKKHI